MAIFDWKSRLFKNVSYLVLVTIVISGFGQGTTIDCPPVTQESGTKGMSNDAFIHIELFNNSTGSYNSGSDVQAANDAIDGWAAMPGSNQDYSTGNYAGTLTDMELASMGTPSDPVVVVEQLSGAALAAHCGASASCATYLIDPDQTITGGVVYQDPSYEANGAGPPAYPATQAEDLSHEIGIHIDMGWNNCASGNCTLSDAGAGMYTGVGPTPCDTKLATQCGR